MKIKRYKTLNEVVYKEVLDNGLTVIVIPKSEYKQVSAYFSTKFGSLTTTFVPNGEKEYITVPLGVAHFLEHKMFVEENGEDASIYFSNLSLDSNAYTTVDKTTYYFTGNKNINEGIIKLLDFVQSPFFTDDGVDKERGIIEQEIKMYLDKPSTILSQGIKENMYLECPIKYDVAGTVDSIKKINKDILFKCYNTFYHPTNMVFVVAGGVDPIEVINVIKKNQESKKFLPKCNIKRKIAVETGEVVKTSGETQMDITIPKVTVAFKLPYEKEKRNSLIEKEILLRILFDVVFGNTTENYKKMKEENLITSSFSAFSNLNAYYGFFRITSDTNKPDEFIEFVKEKLLSFDVSSITEELFSKIKKSYLGDFIGIFNNVDAIANNFLDYYFDDCDVFYWYDYVNNVTINDMKKIGKYLKESAFTSHKIMPNDKSE